MRIVLLLFLVASTNAILRGATRNEGEGMRRLADTGTKSGGMNRSDGPCDPGENQNHTYSTFSRAHNDSD